MNKTKKLSNNTSNNMYLPEHSFPVLHISIYKDEVELLRPLINSTDFYFPNIKIAQGPSNEVNVCLINETTGKMILEFNEFAATPSRIMDYKAHQIFDEVVKAAKEYRNRMDEYFQ